MKDRLDDILMDFLESTLEPFPLSALLRFMGEAATAENYEDLSDYLSYNQLAYLNPSWNGEEPLWISRAGLFTGRTALIRPGKKELAAGVFLPGSRLVPYQDPSYLPHELTFIHNGRILPRVPYETDPDEAYPLYSFFGEEYVPQYLSLDNSANDLLFSDSDGADPSCFSLMAVDVRDVYWSGVFRAGDFLAAKVVDWAGGIFELSVVPAPEESDRDEWLGVLEESLVQEFDSIGPSASMDEQLAFSFFLGQELLFNENAVPVGDLLGWSERVDMEPYGVETRLWHKGSVIPAQSSWAMTLIASPSSLLEESFVLLGLPVNLIVMDSYVKDSLYLREAASDALLKRLLPFGTIQSHFCVPIIERALESRKNELGKTYNRFADNEVGVLRNRYIALHSALSRTIFELQHSGIRPDDIPEQGAVVLGQLMTHTVSAIENLEGYAEETSGDVEALWSSIEGMEDSFFDTRTAIMEVLPSLKKKRFSVIKKEKPDV